MTMVPEAWQDDPLMHPDKRAFYRWSGCVMEPWDGPGKTNLNIDVFKNQLYINYLHML